MADAAPRAADAAADERLRRWRLVLGAEADAPLGVTLSAEAQAMDRALAALYGDAADEPERRAGLGASSPGVARWLGDIRTYFPAAVVRVMQRDAFDRLGLRRMLLEPELLAAVEPDVHLVATLLSLGGVLPARTRETARVVVRRVVDDLERRLASPLRQAVTGALNRATRTRRPRAADIDWHRTIRANLRHYQPEQRTIVPESLVGHTRRQSTLRDVILLVDQSGSMASSVVYSGVLGAVLASLRAVRTRMVAFDTAVVDLSEHLTDPVELLFGVQLGGGTDIHRALGYAQGLVRAPQDTILVLISDLYEGGDRAGMLERAAALVGAGVQVIALLALSDAGAPSYDARTAGAFAALGIPCFACTPDAFPALMAAAIQRADVAAWAAGEGYAVARAAE
jgi:Mg-chelatase subunit ChlD